MSDVRSPACLSLPRTLLRRIAARSLALRRRLIAIAATALAASAVSVGAQAEPGVQTDSVTFAMLAGLSGPAGGPTKTAASTVRAYFATVNASGGVAGRKLQLLDVDDAADPQRALHAFADLEAKQAVLGLVLARSGPVIDALLPGLDRGGVPLLGAVGGSHEAYEGPHRTVFLLRPSFGRETEEACRLAGVMGIATLMSVVPENSAGNEMLDGVQAAITKGYLKAAGSIRYDARTLDVAKLAEQIRARNPTAILVGGPPKAVASIIAATKKLGAGGWFLTQSNNSSGDFVKALGDDPAKVIISQVFPSPRSANVPLALDFQRLAQMADLPLDYAAFEAYITARVAVEALRRAGRNLTRAAFVDALTSLKSFDLGGLAVSFDKDRRVGNTFVELTLLNKAGQFVR